MRTLIVCVALFYCKTIYTNFKPPGKKALGMPKVRKIPSSITSQRIQNKDTNFKAYMDTGVLIGDVKTITAEMKVNNKRIFQQKFACKHTCDADTEDTRSFGINWRGLNPANDYIFGCDKHCISMHEAECNTLMFSCHSADSKKTFRLLFSGQTLSFFIPVVQTAT